jgi:hypothetical protein
VAAAQHCRLLLLLLLLWVFPAAVTHPRTIVTGIMNIGNTYATANLQPPARPSTASE